MHTRISGGESDTEVNEFAVIPWGAPRESRTVKMVIPVAYLLHTRRKCCCSIVVRDIYGHLTKE